MIPTTCGKKIKKHQSLKLWLDGSSLVCRARTANSRVTAAKLLPPEDFSRVWGLGLGGLGYSPGLYSACIQGDPNFEKSPKLEKACDFTAQISCSTAAKAGSKPANDKGRCYA